MKSCAHCKRELSLESFGRNKRKADGLAIHCRECARAFNRESYQRHLEKNRARIREYDRVNPDKAAERSHRHYLANRESIAERHRRWFEENPERANELKRRTTQKRRAQLANLPSEPIDMAEVFERDQGICGICSLPVDPANWWLDHVIPISLGGPHLYSNVQVSHPFCNQSKGGANRPQALAA